MLNKGYPFCHESELCVYNKANAHISLMRNINLLKPAFGQGPFQASSDQKLASINEYCTSSVCVDAFLLFCIVS